MSEEIVQAADRHAEAEARSRSWVVAEAVAAYTGLKKARGEAEAHPDPRAAGLGPFRTEQLAADLDLSPVQRVLEAELTVRLAEIRETRGPHHFVMSFERYDDYLAWKEEDAMRSGGGAS